MRIQIDVINESTKLSEEDFENTVVALQSQVDNEFKETWGMTAHLHTTKKGNASHWWLVFLDDSDQAGALGYHDLTPDGHHPVGKAFVGTDIEYDASPSVTASHELLEMLGDPYIGRTVIDPKTGRLYAEENCDAVEDDSLAYEGEGGVLVSDFVLPQYFDPNHAGLGEALSFKSHVTEPFSLAKGGYLSYIDLNHVSKGWQQVTDEQVPESGRAPGQRPVDPPIGSRREKRTRAWRGELKASTAHTE